MPLSKEIREQWEKLHQWKVRKDQKETEGQATLAGLFLKPNEEMRAHERLRTREYDIKRKIEKERS